MWHTKPLHRRRFAVWFFGRPSSRPWYLVVGSHHPVGPQPGELGRYAALVDLEAQMVKASEHGNMARSNWAGVFPHRLSWFIDNPLRRLIISPATLVERLALSDSSHVLELGPGSGYFSAALAARVPNGRLELFDLQAEMLAKAEQKLRARGFHNVGYTVGNAGEDFSFPEGHFDVAFLSSVLGEVSHQHRCLKSLYRVLRPSGMLAIHESIPDPNFIRLKILRRLVGGQGFKIHRHWGRPWNYTATFVKSESCETESAA